VLDEDCPRHERPGQRGAQTTIHAPGMAVLLIERRGGLLKTLSTEQQLFEVVARPHLASLIDPDTQAWLRKLMAAAELVTITERVAACRDPTDDKFLELAIQRQRRPDRVG
jgi:uncharacterized protein